MYQKILKTTLGAALDFLFPTDERVKKFEDASAANLLRILPASDPLPPPQHVETLFAYSDEQVKHLVWEIKYYRNERLTETISALMAERIQGKIDATEKYFLVPIPLTARRLRERGYNHTELLAKAILKHLKAHSKSASETHFELASNFLKKIRHTPKQHSIENRADRFTNICGAFEVPPDATGSVRNKHMLVIDDVVTTGATVNEATRALLSAGAKSVAVFAVAH